MSGKTIKKLVWLIGILALMDAVLIIGVGPIVGLGDGKFRGTLGQAVRDQIFTYLLTGNIAVPVVAIMLYLRNRRKLLSKTMAKLGMFYLAIAAVQMFFYQSVLFDFWKGPALFWPFSAIINYGLLIFSSIFLVKDITQLTIAFKGGVPFAKIAILTPIYVVLIFVVLVALISLLYLPPICFLLFGECL